MKKIIIALVVLSIVLSSCNFNFPHIPIAEECPLP